MARRVLQRQAPEQHAVPVLAGLEQRQARGGRFVQSGAVAHGDRAGAGAAARAGNALVAAALGRVAERGGAAVLDVVEAGAARVALLERSPGATALAGAAHRVLTAGFGIAGDGALALLDADEAGAARVAGLEAGALA